MPSSPQPSDYDPLARPPKNMSEMLVAAASYERLTSPAFVPHWQEAGINRANRKAMLKRLKKMLGKKGVQSIKRLQARARKFQEQLRERMEAAEEPIPTMSDVTPAEQEEQRRAITREEAKSLLLQMGQDPSLVDRLLQGPGADPLNDDARLAPPPAEVLE